MMPELRNLELKEGRIPDKNQNWRKWGLLMYRRQGQESVPISSSQVTDLIMLLFCLKSFCLFLLYLVWNPNSFWWILIQAWGALAVCIPPSTLRHPCLAPPAPQSSPGNCHSSLGSPLVGGAVPPRAAGGLCVEAWWHFHSVSLVLVGTPLPWESTGTTASPAPWPAQRAVIIFPSPSAGWQWVSLA